MLFLRAATCVRNVALLSLVVWSATVASRCLSAEAIDHSLIPGYERFFSEPDANRVEAGLLLLGELNCTACHAASEGQSEWIRPKQAPVLDQVAQRVRPEYLRAFVADPHGTKPGVTMPSMALGSTDQERRDNVEAIVHFLASGGKPAESAPARQSVANGNKLFHSIGCTACHDPRTDGAPHLATSVPLSNLEAKYTIPSLAGFLENPLAVRPSGRMPHLNLKAEEARDIASYLLKDLQVEANVAFDYFEGSWDTLPDFGSLQPKVSGKCSGFDVLAGDRRNQFGMRFTALVNVPRDGEYRLHLGSDDGSRLLIDGNEVVRNDGVHPHSFKDATAKLSAGVHDLVVEYFEQGGEESLQVDIEGQQLSRRSIEGLLVTSREPRPDDVPEFVVDPALAEKGKQLFVASGCASCHQASGIARGTMASSSGPPTLDASKSTGGCLSTEPSAGLPRYALTASQRESLVAGIEFLKSAMDGPSAERRIRQTMTTFNCYACHQRGEIGGVERERDPFFKTDQQEMGDEGRIPPHLTGVGAKLTADWLKHVFDNGAKDRPYMFTRMPRFGSQNVGQLVAAFGEVDRTSDTTIPEPDVSPRRLKSAGRQLVGSAGFSCIKCHTFGDSKATGIQSINMTTMTRRLRPEWFHQYMLNPQAYRPGTRMPAAWPDGQVLLPSVLDGTPETQIHSIWVYLSDGDKAPPPAGLGSDPEELYAIGEAVIYRNFIDGAGPRAIGVGYPERVNLAFDANNLNIALLWHNSFIDASRHWNGRGQGFQPPLGDNVLRLPAAASLASLDSNESKWPSGPPRESGYRFLGYRLDASRKPTFLYSFGDVRIEDFPNPASSEPFAPLRRTLKLTSEQSPSGVYYRAAVGDKIESLGDGWYQINGSWRTRIESPGNLPILRQVDNKSELLVPIVWNAKQVEIVQQYAW